jgi:Flp pilus assembly protein TadB
MTTIKSILRRSGEAAAREVEDELQFHIEMRTHDNIATGMSPEDAVADAMRRFGDFDHIQMTCEAIRKERMAGIMKLARVFCRIMIGCGLTLEMTAQLGSMRLVGQFLTIISTLWLLLIHLREKRPDQRRFMAAEQLALSVTHTVSDISLNDFAEDLPRPVQGYDKDGRTPVERLRSDEVGGCDD